MNDLSPELRRFYDKKLKRMNVMYVDFEENPSIGDIIYTVDYTVDAEIGTEDYVISERTVTGVDKSRSLYTTIDSLGAASEVAFSAAFRTMQEAQDERKARYAAEGWLR